MIVPANLLLGNMRDAQTSSLDVLEYISCLKASSETGDLVT